MYHESTRCISILFYTNKHDKIKENFVTLENISIPKLGLTKRQKAASFTHNKAKSNIFVISR